MTRPYLCACLCLTVLAVPALESCQTAPGDWPQWRGPKRDGVCRDTGLLSQWPTDGPPLSWRISGLGTGHASVAVAGGKIFTMGHRGGTAFLIALDVKVGRELWATRVDGAPPNSTPTVDGDRVFALGYDGDLLCARVADGQEVWRRHLIKELGGIVSDSGYSESVLIDGERLICTPGGKDAALVALDKGSGKVIWKASVPDDVGEEGKDGAAYASIVVSNAGGVRQYVQMIGRGLISVSASDGRTLWTYNRIANWGANVPTPIVRGEHVFCSTSYSTGAALLKLVPDGSDGVKYEEAYFLPHKVFQNHHGGMVLVGDHVYCGHGHNNGFPLCVELLTGKVAWRPGRGPGVGSAAVLYADGHLYFRYEDGVLALIEATPEQFVLKSTFQIPSKNGKHWAHPVIAAGRLYLRDQDELLCYDVRKTGG